AIPLENDNKPRALPYYTTTVRYSALGIVKLLVKSLRPPHQVFSAAARNNIVILQIIGGGGGGGGLVGAVVKRGWQRMRGRRRGCLDSATDLMWSLALPLGCHRDHEYCNPLLDQKKSTNERIKRLPSCLIRVNGEDPMVYRQKDFANMLEARGVLVTRKFYDEGCHGADVFDPKKAHILYDDGREDTATRVNLDEFGATCDGSPKVISSPLVFPTVIINMPPRGPYDIDVAATFRVPLTIVGDLHMLINDIAAGKHDEILSEMTNNDRMETMDALGTICKSIQADNTNTHVTPCKSVDINTTSTSYAGVACAHAKNQPKVKVNYNFHPLVVDPVFDGVNISILRKVVEKEQLGETWAEKDFDEFQRLFFFKFDLRAGLEAVLEGGPWLIQDGISLIATFIGKPVMLDSYTSSMCNDSCGRSRFARCLIEVNSDADLVDVVTIGVPSLTGNDFTKETIHVVSPPIVTTSNGVTPTVEKANDSFQTATTSAPKKGATNVGDAPKKRANTGPSSKTNNIPTLNSYSALNVGEEDEEEVVENVYDESANLFTKTKTGGSSSFTVVAGFVVDLGIHGLGLVIVAIGKKLVVVLVEIVPASSMRIGYGSREMVNFVPEGLPNNPS
nr:probable carboxylesterase 8 [Tanacetum cinerariifolium]